MRISNYNDKNIKLFFTLLLCFFSNNNNNNRVGGKTKPNSVDNMHKKVIIVNNKSYKIYITY